MRQNLNKLEKTIGYLFKDIELLEKAVTHRSFSHIHNERLEFLGDAILNFAIAAKLYEVFPEANEGELSRLRALMVRGESLAKLAQEFSLGDYINLGSGELKSGGFRRPSILADALEALIGAIYLDSNSAVCIQVVSQWFADHIAIVDQLLDIKDPKTRLQEYLQARKKALPDYQLLKMEGQHHDRSFFVECSVTGYDVKTQGAGPSRRKAEQEAANAFLQVIENDR